MQVCHLFRKQVSRGELFRNVQLGCKAQGDVGVLWGGERLDSEASCSRYALLGSVWLGPTLKDSVLKGSGRCWFSNACTVQGLDTGLEGLVCVCVHFRTSHQLDEAVFAAQATCLQNPYAPLNQSLRLLMPWYCNRFVCSSIAPRLACIQMQHDFVLPSSEV